MPLHSSLNPSFEKGGTWFRLSAQKSGVVKPHLYFQKFGLVVLKRIPL